MMVRISIKQLSLSVILGTKPAERRHKQKITIDLSFEYNAKKAIESDTLTHAIDYEQLTKTIIKEASRTHFFLVEALADFILEIAMKDQRIQKADVVVYKPNAIKGAQGIAVHLSIKNRG